MSVLREAITSTRGRIVAAVIVALIGWQAWLSLAAAGKIAVGFPEQGSRLNALVTLPFPPERFHIQKFQQLGRVSGTKGNSVQVRGVNRAELKTLARPFWVSKVEPLT
ncbi:hypothetical protein ACFPOB_22245 [Bosea eneae]|uniref:Uncharacterized protein n=1 Tax=Bosea eneae TaxID=151454 RepID=A0ABW0IXB6_9HYPH